MKVSILGTGDLARALAKRFALHGFDVVCGSRDPKDRDFRARDPSFEELSVDIVSIEECLKFSDIIILALHADHINLTKYQRLLAGKILVDTTNEESESDCEDSHAQSLSAKLEDGTVVKAFNTVSAYELEYEESSDRKVYVCGDPEAAAQVELLARGAGFNAISYGLLKNARHLERDQRALWRGWGRPLVLATGSFILWGVYGTMRYQMWKGNPWSMWPLNTLNKVFACTSLSMLSLCYLPGCVAATIQVVRGTKHKAFPRWLDSWLRMRKQLGLIALYLAGTHCVMSLAHLSPPYFPNWYDTLKVVVPPNLTEAVVIPIGVRMNWKGETVLCLGGLALGVMSVLGITSIPSVGAAMNWRQWNFVHTKMGYTCLAIASAHVLLKGAPDWMNKSFADIAKGMI